MTLDGIRRLALGNLREEDLRGLVSQEEHLFVERKREPPPPPKFGAAVASFANTLGGWLLLGIEDKTGDVVGWDPGERVDIQSHLGNLLRAEVDPLPPYVADRRTLDGTTIVVMRVFESVDTPHIVRGTGAVYTRSAKGKEPVDEQAVLFQLARRGEEGRVSAMARLSGEPLVRHVTQPPLPENHWIKEISVHVRAGPVTVTPQFAEWALSERAVEALIEGMEILAKTLTSTTNVRDHHNLIVEPYGRGAAVKWVGGFQVPLHLTLMVDAAGVAVGRLAQPADPENPGVDQFTLAALKQRYLGPLVREVATTLVAAEAYGHVVWEMLVSRPTGVRMLGVSRPPHWWLHASADGVIPAEGDELDELIEFWIRHVAREAGEPLWEGTLE